MLFSYSLFILFISKIFDKIAQSANSLFTRSYVGIKMGSKKGSVLVYHLLIRCGKLSLNADMPHDNYSQYHSD